MANQITEIVLKAKEKFKQDRLNKERDKRLIRQRKRDKRKADFIKFIKTHNRMPSGCRREELDLYNFKMFHYYPSSEGYLPEFREEVLSILEARFRI